MHISTFQNPQIYKRSLNIHWRSFTNGGQCMLHMSRTFPKTSSNLNFSTMRNPKLILLNLTAKNAKKTFTRRSFAPSLMFTKKKKFLECSDLLNHLRKSDIRVYLKNSITPLKKSPHEFFILYMITLEKRAVVLTSKSLCVF